jgi:hypothetical protein
VFGLTAAALRFRAGPSLALRAPKDPPPPLATLTEAPDLVIL